MINFSTSLSPKSDTIYRCLNKQKTLAVQPGGFYPEIDGVESKSDLYHQFKEYYLVGG